MKKYSVSQEKILRELADFQYLTVSQFVRLGITKSKNGMYKALRGVSDEHKPSTLKISCNPNPAIGRLETVYYLSNIGVKHLVTLGLEVGDIKYPKRDSVSFASDYYHRIYTVDFFISLKNWAIGKGKYLPDFFYYFQQSSGSQRNNKGGKSLSDTRLDIEMEGVGYIVPDGVFTLKRKDKTPIFGLFEQHNGKDTKKLLGQIRAHCVAMKLGAPSLKYNIQHDREYIANRVFVSFEHEACMQATMHRLAKNSDFLPYMQAFVFKLSDDVIHTCFTDKWFHANGKIADFF
jgi:hypothetical protein